MRLASKRQRITFGTRVFVYLRRCCCSSRQPPRNPVQCVTLHQSCTNCAFVCAHFFSCCSDCRRCRWSAPFCAFCCCYFGCLRWAWSVLVLPASSLTTVRFVLHICAECPLDCCANCGPEQKWHTAGTQRTHCCHVAEVNNVPVTAWKRAVNFLNVTFTGLLPLRRQRQLRWHHSLFLLRLLACSKQRAASASRSSSQATKAKYDWQPAVTITNLIKVPAAAIFRFGSS